MNADHATNTERLTTLDSNISNSLSPALQQRLADILDEYLISLEQGVPLDVERITQDNPELAEPLREYLEGLAILQNDGADLQLNSRSSLPPRAEVPMAKRLGDFELIREVGRGGMGVVYEARQLSLDRFVALKVLPFAAMLDEKQIARFENEARAAAQLHHPNIVPIHGVGSDRGVHFFAMQLINGQSLQQVIRDLREDKEDGRCDSGTTENSLFTRTAIDLANGVRCDETREYKFESHDESPQPQTHNSSASSLSDSFSLSSSVPVRNTEYIRTVVGLIIQAADGLEAAHQYGVIHRDVKPSNLMLDDSGKIWITDFGLARFQSDHSVTRSGEILGTLHYMSPEQATGHNALVDERSDVYSLGVTLYELLTLKRPFEGESQHQVIDQIEQGVFPRPRTWNSRIPFDLENVILKAMAVAREDRYDSAQEFADDLRRYVDGKPTRAKRPLMMQQVFKWTRRHHRGVLITCVTLALGVVGLVTSNLLLKQQSDRTAEALLQSRINLTLAQDAVEVFVEDVDRLLEPSGYLGVREKLLEHSLEYYQQFIKQADHSTGLSIQLKYDVAIAKTKMANIKRLQSDFDSALTEYESAAEMFRAIQANNNRNPVDEESLDVDYVRCLGLIGEMRFRVGDVQRAFTSFQEAVAAGQARIDTSSRMRCAVAELQNNAGLLQSELGNSSESIELYEKGLQLVTSNNSQPSSEQLELLSALHNNLWQATRHDDPKLAQQHIKAAIRASEQLVEIDDAPNSKSLLAGAHNNHASHCIEQNRLDAAEKALQVAAELQRELVQNEPTAARYRNDLAVTLNNLGHLFIRIERSDRATAAFRESVSYLQSLVRNRPGDPHLLSHLGGAHNNLALVHNKEGRTSEAIRDFQQGVKHLRSAFEKAPRNANLRESLSRSYFNYGQLLAKLGYGYQAAKVALQRRKLWPTNGDQLHAVAIELALAYQKTTSPDRQQKIEKHAVETIGMAVNAGWQPADVETDIAIRTFRKHPEFVALLRPFIKDQEQSAASN